MNYLKKFNESKFMVDSNDLNDILIELSDIGYKYSIQTTYWSDKGNRIAVTLYPKETSKSLYYEDLGEYIERLQDYLKSEGYEPWTETTKKIEKFKLDGEEGWNISFEWKQD